MPPAAQHGDKVVWVDVVGQWHVGYRVEHGERPGQPADDRSEIDGKLDVPKSGSSPTPSRDGDGSLLFGWDRDRVLPLLAGLAELMPWVAR